MISFQVYRDVFDMTDSCAGVIEIFELARESCPTLCGCKVSGPLSDELASYKPDEYAVITTGHLNLIRSMRLPSTRGAIISSFEPPIYRPVLDAYYGGRMEEAEALEAHITNFRQPTADLNDLLGESPSASDTSVYCIAANKALADGVEGALGPCRLPLMTAPAAQAAKLKAAVLPLLEDAAVAEAVAQAQASGGQGGQVVPAATRGRL